MEKDKHTEKVENYAQILESFDREIKKGSLPKRTETLALRLRRYTILFCGIECGVNLEDYVICKGSEEKNTVPDERITALFNAQLLRKELKLKIQEERREQKDK